jgi:hypothetical protein
VDVNNQHENGSFASFLEKEAGRDKFADANGKNTKSSFASFLARKEEKKEKSPFFENNRLQELHRMV